MGGEGRGESTEAGPEEDFVDHCGYGWCV